MDASKGYVIERGSIAVGEKRLLDGLGLHFPDHTITAIMGPGAVGKTTLLRVLSGAAPGEVRVDGMFTLRDLRRDHWPTREIAHIPQQRDPISVTSLCALSTGKPSVLLLDEPLVRTDHEQRALSELLVAQRTRGLGVIVTHDLTLARAVSDHVCLLCAGKVESFQPVSRFFDAPATALAAQFVRQGNCWPRPALPSHFHWVRPGLAGMGRPGLLGDADADLRALAEHGVDTLISLTLQRFPPEQLRRHGIVGRHLPIADMGVPSIHAAASLCRDIARMQEDGARVALHCDAGLGRTGTLLSSYLVWQGAAADQAIEEVRAMIRGALQTPSQELFVHRFAEAFGGGT